MRRPRSRLGSFIHNGLSSGENTPNYSPNSSHDFSIMSYLRKQFESYARYGFSNSILWSIALKLYFSFGKDRHKDNSHITLTQSDRWLRQAEILDGRKITTTDTAILFKSISQ